MAQTAILIQALKRALKAHGKTYADVAVALDISEASVKRLFAEHSLSLDRLEQICQMMRMDFAGLFRLMDESDVRIKHLSLEQEKQISENLTLLLVTVCVLNRWTLDNITSYYRINELECIQHLAMLDRMKIIELLPKNKIKLLVSPNFAWRENGPIQQFFQKRIAAEYFTTKFVAEDESLIVLNGMLTHASNKEFQRKMLRLAKEFDELNHEDVGQAFDSRNGYTVILAVRGWNYGLFKPLIKPENTK